MMRNMLVQDVRCFFFLGVVQSGWSVAFQGRMPRGLAFRLALASSKIFCVVSLVISLVKLATSLFAVKMACLYEDHNASAVQTG